MGEKLQRILPKVATSTSLLVPFTYRKFTTWDRWLYFPSEGRRAEDFFARKIRRLRPDLKEPPIKVLKLTYTLFLEYEWNIFPLRRIKLLKLVLSHVMLTF